MTTIFISRKLKDDSPLLKISDDVSWIDYSLLRISSVNFSIPNKPYDWIFFYSSNGVRYFFKRADVSDFKDTKFGVMGPGTALTFKKITTRSPDYIGQGDASSTAEFLTRYSALTLFIKGKNSLSSIERYLPVKQIEELVVYSNEIDTSLNIEDADIYILTSPMNAQAYMSNRCCRFNTRIIAIGQTTNRKLMDYGFLLASVPDSPSEQAIANLLKEMIL